MRTLENIKTKTRLKFELGRGEHIFAKTETGETVVFGVTSLADEKTKTPISWHYHDVFKRGEVQGILRKHTRHQYPWGKITTYRVLVPIASLYDFEKLKDLYHSEEFQSRRFSFFRYAVVEKLLGKKPKKSIKAMSGLFGCAK